MSNLSKKELKKLIDKFNDPKWRLNNLYWIVNKEGNKIKFNLNWAQQRLLDEGWYKNIVLKARQLGISTYICLLFLDRCLFNPNQSAGIIAHTREDAEHMFKRIKFAYDNLTDDLKAARSAQTASARELVFSNGSGIRVGTSMRSSTLQWLHISEFGKICAHYPDKAREIMTGALNTVSTNQYIFIESTAEGRGGHFYDLCKSAEELQIGKKELTTQDYRFFFFPWWECPDYTLEANLDIPSTYREYFEKLSYKGIDLSKHQKIWYLKKAITQRDDIKREYPSYPDEAFEAANEAAWYGKWLMEARFQGRVTNVPWDREAPVHIAMDIGFADATAIGWFQLIGQEIHVIDYYENSGEALHFYVDIIKKKPYTYGQYFGPHDMAAREKSSGLSYQESALKLGIPFVVLQNKKDIGFAEGVNISRTLFPRIWIDDKNCDRLIKCLENYRKVWDPNYETYKDVAVHNEYSHGADMFRYMSVAISTHIDSSKDVITEAQAENLYNKHHPLFE